MRIWLASLISILVLAACQNNKPPQGATPFSDRNQSIFGGSKVTQKEAISKSIVAIGIHKKSKMDIFCTGTLISPRIILTAAHCLEEKDVRDLHVIFNVGEGQVSRAVIHKTYESDMEWSAYSVHDIALLKLKKSAPQEMVPMELVSEDLKIDPKNAVVNVAGYGVAGSIESKIGQELIGKTGVLQQALVSLINSPDDVYWFDQTKGNGICAGDSGGPAYLEIEGKLRLIGSAIATKKDVDNEDWCRGSSIFTKIQIHLPWIREQIKNLTEDDFN